MEAAELLELFQWQSPEEVRETNVERIKEELADVLIYSHMLASNLDLDIDEIIEAKLDKSKGNKENKEKYTELLR